MTISCHKLTGEFIRNIIVTTNDPEHPVETLACKGRILEPVRLSPRNVNFGTVSPATATARKTVSISRGDGGPVDLKLHPVNVQGVEAEVNEIESGERYELVVALAPPFGSQRIRTALRLETGVPESPSVTVPVYATISP